MSTTGVGWAQIVGPPPDPEQAARARRRARRRAAWWGASVTLVFVMVCVPVLKEYRKTHYLFGGCTAAGSPVVQDAVDDLAWLGALAGESSVGRCDSGDLPHLYFSGLRLPVDELDALLVSHRWETSETALYDRSTYRGVDCTMYVADLDPRADPGEAATITVTIHDALGEDRDD